jgi:hypothetical protein
MKGDELLDNGHKTCLTTIHITHLKCCVDPKTLSLILLRYLSVETVLKLFTMVKSF